MAMTWRARGGLAAPHPVIALVNEGAVELPGQSVVAGLTPLRQRLLELRLRYHARRAEGIRMTLLTTERLFWHCGNHTAEPLELASSSRPIP